MTDGRYEAELALAGAWPPGRRRAPARYGWARVGSVRHKSAKDVVTEVDHLSEALILEAIHEAHPDDGVLAEESGLAAGENGRVWVVDPLDGTINYANGIPLFCVSIGLVVDGVPSVGVVRDPIRGEAFAATVEVPATSTVGPSRPAQGAPVGLRDRPDDRWGTPVRAAEGHPAGHPGDRRLGSSALALAYVGNGRFDAFAQTHGLSPWDVAAAGLIAERAGATVTDASGGPWFESARGTRTFGVVAASPDHHARLLDLIRTPA